MTDRPTVDLAALERLAKEAIAGEPNGDSIPRIDLANALSPDVVLGLIEQVRAAARPADGEEGLRAALERGHLMWVHTPDCAFTTRGEPCDCGLADEQAATNAEPDTSQGDAEGRLAEASQNAGPGTQHVRRAATNTDYRYVWRYGWRWIAWDLRDGRPMAALRQFYWRMIRGYVSETCERCGRPYFLWHAPDELWSSVTGYPQRPGDNAAGLYCPVCFDRKATRLGITLKWRPLVFGTDGDEIDDLTRKLRDMTEARDVLAALITERERTQPSTVEPDELRRRNGRTR